MTYRRLTSLFICVPIWLGSICFSQDSEDDELFELSPFQVSSDHGYRAQNKVRTGPVITINDIGATIDGWRDCKPSARGRSPQVADMRAARQG